MTTSILRPDAVGSLGSGGGYTLTGATTYGALSDNSDATHVAFDAVGDTLYVSLGTVALPTGAVTKSVNVRLRVTTDGDAVQLYAALGIAGGATLYTASQVVSFLTSTASFGAQSAAWSQSQVTSLELAIVYMLTDTAGTVATVREAYVDLVYCTIPVVTVSLPTGAQATSTPSIAWSYAGDADGGAQTTYEIKVFDSATYGGGGFSANTSTPTWTSGITTSSAHSATSGVLANSGTYRAYVRAAGTVNGALQWSDWAYSGFTTSFTAPSVLTVTASATSASGYIDVTVTRSTAGANTAWEAVRVQRSIDAGATWTTIRGGDQFSSTGTFVQTWGASTAVIRDYEVPNGTTVSYRAQAYTSTPADLWGSYTSSSSTSWSSSDYWLKAPHAPTYNTKLVDIAAVTPVQRTRNPKIHAIEGREDPIVVSSPVLHTIAGSIVLQTLTQAGADALELLLEESDVVLLQWPSGDRWGSRYIAAVEASEIRRVDNTAGRMERYWEASFVEVTTPADLT